jgi:hypothetical protein
MNKFERLLKRIDSIAPDPWYIDGVKQARPVTQLGCVIGMIIGLIAFFIFK